MVQVALKKFLGGANKSSITRPNCALDRRRILCLYVSGFQRQVFKLVKSLSERSKEIKEQKKNKGSVLVSEFAHNLQNAHNVWPHNVIFKKNFYANFPKKNPVFACNEVSTLKQLLLTR